MPDAGPNASAPTVSEPVASASTPGAGGVDGAGGSGALPSSSGGEPAIPAADAGSDSADAASEGAGGAASGVGVGPFGITELYPSAPGGGRWTSEHWADDAPYAIDGRTDPHDPQAISGARGTGTLQISEGGELVFEGSQPRIYVYPSEAGPWRDIEVTVYYQRVEDDGTAWAGLVIGARSGPEGHGETPCDAHTYYARLREDGAFDFEKELMHTPSSTRGQVAATEVWPPDGELPFGTWIGMKYVVYNQGQAVKLEAYRDMTEGLDGGEWELLSETLDDGGWFTQTTCDEHSPVDGQSDMVQLEGGVTFVRNTGVIEARYKWLTIREISP